MGRGRIADGGSWWGGRAWGGSHARRDTGHDVAGGTVRGALALILGLVLGCEDSDACVQHHAALVELAREERVGCPNLEGIVMALEDLRDGRRAAIEHARGVDTWVPIRWPDGTFIERSREEHDQIRECSSRATRLRGACIDALRVCE